MDEMAGASALNESIAVFERQKIGFNEITVVAVRARTPDNDRINSRIHDLIEYIAPYEPAGTC
jgi:hypothetical protein